MNDPSTLVTAVARQQKQNRRQTYLGLVFLVVAIGILFILPNALSSPYDVMAMGVGAAALFSVLLALSPESLRSRGGSLVPAFCLAGTLWLLAAICSVVPLL